MVVILIFSCRSYSFSTEKDKSNSSIDPAKSRLGSFYLRLGAVAFGIGSMVYSGLEFGQYFELKGKFIT